MPKKSKKSGKKKTDLPAGIGHSASPLGIGHSAVIAGIGHSAMVLGTGHSITFKPKRKVGEIRIEHDGDGNIRLNLLP